MVLGKLVRHRKTNETRPAAYTTDKNKLKVALIVVAHWVGHRPTN